MNYAFVIDNRRCIGCHACSVACKVEHSVPLGVARTWVKYVEKGIFPETRRTFTVTRCNHCDDAPCVEICPTTALYRRSDGIVDFDNQRCIGCKGCMQACPYDALYIDPVTETAAKCNFCAHRVEVGLEPPCVTVCPTQAIVAGDLDDPTSQVNHLRFREPVQVRKPEKGTKPKVFYVEGDSAALVPSAAPPASDYMWSQAAGPMPLPLTEEAGAPRRTFGVKEQHRNSWGFRVSAYLWTKSLAAGAFIVPALLALIHREDDLDLRLPALVALAFLWTLTRPQWRSWLTRGAYIITAYGGAIGLVYLLARAGRPIPPWGLTLSLLLGFATAIYTAFLFGQSKGRDLWQSPLLGPHLAVQALAAGAALFAPGWLLFIVPIHGLFVAAEVFGRHPTEDARRAAHIIEEDPVFTTGVLVLGHLLPLVLLWGAQGPAILARVLVLAGLLFWEHLYVQAPQMVPNA